MINTSNISNFLNADAIRILNEAITTIVNDVVMFDGDIDTNSIITAAEVAKAIDALLKEKTYIDREGNKFEPAKIQNFLNLHQVTMQEIAETLLNLGETDLFNAIDALGKLCFKQTWTIKVKAAADIEKAPVVEKAPVIEKAPVVQKAPVTQKAPVIEKAPVVQKVPEVEQLLLESESKHVVIYKAQSGELAIRFPSEKIRNQFLCTLEKTAIPPQFRKGEQYDYNPKGYTPTIYEGQNNRLFIPSYEAGHKEFAVNCGSAANRDLLIKMMGLKVTEKYGDCDTYGDDLFSIFHNKQQDNTIYFNPKNPIFNKQGALLKINTSTGDIVRREIKKLDHSARGNRKDYYYMENQHLGAIDLDTLKAKVAMKEEKVEKPVKIVQPAPQIKLEEPKKIAQALPDCIISAAEEPYLSDLYIEFPSQELRDRWEKAFNSLAHILGVLPFDECLTVAYKDKPTLLEVKASEKGSALGVSMRRLPDQGNSQKDHFVLAVNFGKKELRDFFVKSLGISGQDHANIYDQIHFGMDNILSFHNHVVNRKGASARVKFNEDALAQLEGFLYGKPAKIIQPAPQIKLEEPKKIERAPIECRISTNNKPSSPQLHIKFPSKELRDRWHKTFVGVAMMLGLDNPLEASQVDPSLLIMKTTMRKGSPGLHLRGYNPEFYSSSSQLGMDLGDPQLLDFVVESLGFNQSEHTSAVKQGSFVTFSPLSLNLEGASFTTEFNEAAMADVEYFLVDDNDFSGLLR